MGEWDSNDIIVVSYLILYNIITCTCTCTSNENQTRQPTLYINYFILLLLLSVTFTLVERLSLKHPSEFRITRESGVFSIPGEEPVRDYQVGGG